MAKDLQDAVNASLSARLTFGRRQYHSGNKTIFEHAASALKVAQSEDTFEETLSTFMDPYWGESVLWNRKTAFPPDVVRGLQFAVALAVKDSISVSRGRPIFERFFGADVRPGDLVFSMNYDTLPEQYLGKGAFPLFPLGRPGLDQKSAEGGFGARLNNVVGILHLHGTYSLYVCNRCGFIHDWRAFNLGESPEEVLEAMARHQYGCDFAESLQSGPCGGQLSPAIVPPFTQKGSFAGSVAPMWRAAYSLTEKIREVVIVGWSLPPFDTEGRRLLRTILGTGHVERIAIVSERGAALDRLERIANGVPIELHVGGLEGYVSRT